MDHELDEFEIDIDGVLVGLFFGSAWLEPDEHGSFYVHRVALAGRTGKTERTPVGGVRTHYSTAVLALDRNTRDPLAAALFSRIADQLEADTDLQLRFEEHRAAA